MYVRHTGYPGGQRHTAAQDMRAKHPERMIEIAVRGMLPKTKLGDKIYTHLKVFTGPEHKHQAQSPTPITPHVF
jgi:large subunit ribosomal protein L13